ncbi:molybdate ABC transporter permease subunit [Acetobacter fabarum]|uniref:molybdate ABC transporter permease subunit n=1 Tax=Acetobacter fabarum TaxID=483199 RepID=UPI00312B5951
MMGANPLFDPNSIFTALRLSVTLACVTTILALGIGVPLAWWLANCRNWWRDVCSSIITLPLVLPPTVLGFYLLLALGPSGLGALAVHITGRPTFAFSFAGLTVGSVIAALPYIVQSTQAAFETTGRKPLEIAYTLRTPPLRAFLSVALPLAAPGIIAGAVIAFAHTIGEFGLILMIGGDIPGQTRLLSIMLFDNVETGDWASAHAIAGGMVAFAFMTILILRLTQKRLTARPC